MENFRNISNTFWDESVSKLLYSNRLFSEVIEVWLKHYLLNSSGCPRIAHGRTLNPAVMESTTPIIDTSFIPSRFPFLSFYSGSHLRGERNRPWELSSINMLLTSLRYIFVPMGKSLTIKSIREKMPQPNTVLEAAYRKKSNLNHATVKFVKHEITKRVIRT